MHRAPLYWRYNVQYANGLPYLAPTHNNQDPNLDQHWPNAGETVKFGGEIRNHGDVTVSGFQYRWRLDGLALPLQTYSGTVTPGQVVNVTTSWTWPQSLADHTVTLEVDPNGLLADAYPQNNTYTDHTNALSYSIWVEQGLYDRFASHTNGFGTRGFDDWIRWQFDTMRANFSRSAYPVIAPQGILERIRIEEINVIPFDPNNLNNFQQYLDNDPHAFLNDGRWQFVWWAGSLNEKVGYWQGYIDQYANLVDWGLIHELTHQLGVIDEYRMNLPSRQSNHVRDQYGREVSCTHLFHQGGLMGGGYVADGYSSEHYDSHTAGYLNRNLHFRRGYYGEYLFDMPATVVCRLLDRYDQPLVGAKVDVFQKDPGSEELYEAPIFTAFTDAQGQVTLPNRTVTGVTTATGHTLHNNPFGRLSVVGQDGTLFLRVRWAGQEDFRWLEVEQLNEAFWRGETQTTNLAFHLAIDGHSLAHVSRTNLAKGRPVAASTNTGLAHYANDGDRDDPLRTWQPNPSTSGQWWQVDLGRVCDIGEVSVYSFAGNRHDWYSRFHLEASPSGSFSGEQAKVPLESDWDVTRSCGDYGLQRFSGTEDHVLYKIPVTRGRYFRIVSDVDQPWVQLQEVELFPVLYEHPAVR